MEYPHEYSLYHGQNPDVGHALGVRCTQPMPAITQTHGQRVVYAQPPTTHTYAGTWVGTPSQQLHNLQHRGSISSIPSNSGSPTATISTDSIFHVNTGTVPRRNRPPYQEIDPRLTYTEFIGFGRGLLFDGVSPPQKHDHPDPPNHDWVLHKTVAGPAQDLGSYKEVDFAVTWIQDDDDASAPQGDLASKTEASDSDQELQDLSRLESPEEVLEPALLSLDELEAIFDGAENISTSPPGNTTDTSAVDQASVVDMEPSTTEAKVGTAAREEVPAVIRDISQGGGTVTPIEGLKRLGLDSPDVQAQTVLPPSTAAQVSGDTVQQPAVERDLRPTAPSVGSKIWINRCMLKGIGKNSIDRFAYTKLILPRRAGLKGDYLRTSCDLCNSCIMYAKYRDPEIWPEAPPVTTYILYLEYLLLKVSP